MIAQIGGVFLNTDDPKKLAAWYRESLGMKYEYEIPDANYGLTFPYNEVDSGQKRYIVFSINKSKEGRPQVEGKVFTLNLRVHDMDKTIAHLKSKNIPVKGADVHPEGKFAWITDPEGNFIELWEDSPQK